MLDSEGDRARVIGAVLVVAMTTAAVGPHLAKLQEIAKANDGDRALGARSRRQRRSLDTLLARGLTFADPGVPASFAVR